MIELVVLLAICALLANLFAWLLTRKRPLWSRRKTAMVAALPVPALVCTLCLFVIINAAAASRASCGVDACGMAMMFSMIGFLCGLVGFVAGLGGALIAISIGNKHRSEGNVADTFE